MGTWKSFYIGFYGAIINAFNTNTLVYLRFSNIKYLTPHLLKIDNNTNNIIDKILL
jgi:hypothetical protein